MFIFFSILIVVVSLIIMSRIYKKMYPGMKLVRTELVLIPFRSKFCFNPLMPVVVRKRK